MTTQPDFREAGEDFLLHYGRLGMKWGLRNMRRTYDDNQIKDARKKVKFDEKHAKRLERTFSGKAAKSEASRIRANLAGNDQVRIAKLRTTGEKKAILILTLGVGSVYLGRNRAIYNPKIARGREEVNRILAERMAEKTQRKREKVIENRVTK